MVSRAEAWVARMKDPDATRKDRAACAAWRLQSPEHAQAYAEAEKLWERTGAYLDILKEDPAVSDILTEARMATAEREPRSRQVWAAVAALVFTIVGAAWIMTRSTTPAAEPRLLATAIGERTAVALEDGSHVTLDAATRVQILYGSDKRTARLLDGRARFAVASDASRPFTVEAGIGSATALGTIFDVSAFAEMVTVTVIEGRVEVLGDRDAPGAGRARLEAGQCIVLSAESGLSSPEIVDFASASAWRDGRLIFNDVALGEAVAEINRYSKKPIRFADTALADLELRGTFNADDPTAFLEAVTFLFPIRAIERDSTIVLTADPSRER